jgi:hypothetical protein
MASCHQKGPWDSSERVRGRGAWRGEDGSLIYHAGDRIFVDGTWHEPGLIKGFVYPADAPIKKPAHDPAPVGEQGPGQKLFDLYKCWNWRRGELDALLYLGLTGASMIGGALEWRPLGWITGDTGTGKSTLQRAQQNLFGNMLIAVADATEASLRQKLGHQTLPVSFDEIEASTDNRRNDSIVQFARRAASGSLSLRGGQNHQHIEFVARSCFQFSSVLMQPMLTQDRNRMWIGELDNLRSEKAPDVNPAMMRELGQKILRRLFDGWPRLAQSLDMYRACLAEKGHSARGCDVFGTMLACADIILHDEETDSDSARCFAEKLASADLNETAENSPDHERFLQHLTTLIVKMEGNKFSSIGELIFKAARDPFDLIAEEAQRILGAHGLKVDRAAKKFCVANYHAGLADLLSKTHWAGRSGASGVWVQTLRRIPGAERTSHPIYFSGGNSRAMLLPLELVLAQPDPSQSTGTGRLAAAELQLDR